MSRSAKPPTALPRPDQALISVTGLTLRFLVLGHGPNSLK